MKWFSRKFFITMTIMAVAVFLKANNKLNDWAFVSLMLIPSMIYLFVNGAIKINSIKTSFDNLKIDLQGIEEDNTDETN